MEEKYKFSDFTLSNYERLIELAEKKYIFCNYRSFANKSNELLWRHDVEFSPEISLKMAKIESSYGVKASYFINVHSEFYNFFEKKTYKQIMEIIKLGHDIGVHLDFHFYDISDKGKLEKIILKEKNILESFLDVEIESFSYHNTSPLILSWNDEEIGGLINVYSTLFRESVHYCTDSTGIWRYERLEDKLKETRNCGLQVLTHDGMWQDQIMSPRKRVFKCIDDRANSLKSAYDYLLNKNHQKNVDNDQEF